MPPEIIQLIFDAVPLPYLQEYINIDQISQYAFNSYYSNITIVDFHDVGERWSDLEKPKPLLGETDVFPTTYNSKNIYGSLNYPGDTIFLERRGSAPSVYFLNVDDFIDFGREHPSFSPLNVIFIRPRDVLRLCRCSEMVPRIRKIYLFTELIFRGDYEGELQDCQSVIGQGIPNINYGYLFAEASSLNLQTYPHHLDYLQLDNCQIRDFEGTFVGFSITHLIFDRVEMEFNDIASIPMNVKYLSLKRSLGLDSGILDIRYPPNLIQLIINEFRGDGQIINVNLLTLTKLRYLQIMPVQVMSLSDLELPNSIEILKLGAPKLKTLEGIEKYHNLYSFYFQSFCGTWFDMPLWAQTTKENLADTWENHTLFCDDYSQAGIVSISSFPKERIKRFDISGEYDVDDLKKWRYFGLIDYPSLTVLDLSETTLLLVTSWIFPETLITLDLSSCKILKFKNHNFKRLTSLRRLYLRENQFKSLEGLIDSLPMSLKELDLLDNQITKFQGSHLSILSVNLSDNDLFHILISLETISLPDCCEILKLDHSDFHGFGDSFLFPKNLKELSTGRCHEFTLTNANFFSKLPQDLCCVRLYGPCEHQSAFPKEIRQICLRHVPKFALNDLLFLEELELISSLVRFDMLPPSLRKLRVIALSGSGSLEHLANLERILVKLLFTYQKDKFVLPESVKYISIRSGSISREFDYSKCKGLRYLELGHNPYSADKFASYIEKLIGLNPIIRIYLGPEISNLTCPKLDLFRRNGHLLDQNIY